MISLYNVIKKPLITEKAVDMKEGMNQIVFAVDKMANKNVVKQAVEHFFNVKVKSVRTMNCKGKTKRFSGIKGKRNDWKKAVVTLDAGEKLEFV